MKLMPLLILIALLESRLSAQECTSQWKYLLDTDPNHPKVISGDSNTAYALFAFDPEPNIRYELKGNFPYARFLSLETNEGKWGFKTDAIFDRDINADLGSDNPYREGNDLNSFPRSYTVNVLPPEETASFPNTIKLPKNKGQHSILARIYSPLANGEISENDFPRIFAYDLRTGAATHCPNPSAITWSMNLPQILLAPIIRKPEFDILDVKVPMGPNSAIPYYVATLNRMRRNDIALFKFKAPRTAQSESIIGSFKEGLDSRYWSFCSVNELQITTLNCLPDFQAKVDEVGDVTIVFGKGDDVLKAAYERGYSFLADTRDRKQKVAQFVYRNILPNPKFAAQDMNEGAYRLRGILCDVQDFLTGRGCEIK